MSEACVDLLRSRAARRRTARTTRAVVGSAHPGPTLAVTTLAALLATASRLDPARAARVTGAVLLGQLSVGWANDVIDAERDRTSARGDKPVAAGTADPRLITGLTGAALLGCAAVSATLGRRSALTHLGLVVLPAQTYNLGLKGTWWSWLPYAVAFGSLPSVVSLAGPHPAPAAARVTGPAAALGVGAHLLNTIRDLEDDARTGIDGLPHRLGERRSRWLATGLLAAASAVVTARGHALTGWARLAVWGLEAAIGWAAIAGTGRTPFRAATAIALLDAGVVLAESRGQAGR